MDKSFGMIMETKRNLQEFMSTETSKNILLVLYLGVLEQSSPNVNFL